VVVTCAISKIFKARTEGALSSIAFWREGCEWVSPKLKRSNLFGVFLSGMISGNMYSGNLETPKGHDLPWLERGNSPAHLRLGTATITHLNQIMPLLFSNRMLSGNGLTGECNELDSELQ
jgi:hypothetical protein